jgi:hypothetical protein
VPGIRSRSRSMLVRRVLDEVPYGALPSEIRFRIEEVSAVLPTLSSLPLDAVQNAPNSSFGRLTHRLSGAFAQYNLPAVAVQRSEDERAALAGLAENLSTDFDGFLRALGGLNFQLTRGAGGWRRGDIRLGPDRFGNRIQLPGVTHLPQQLGHVRRVLQDRRLLPLWKSTLVLALIVNCHPFTDGNGRVARVLFNCALHGGGMPHTIYFPFYEIARRSIGGYEIALRQAEIKGDWVPLVSYVVSAVQCYRELTIARASS